MKTGGHTFTKFTEQNDHYDSYNRLFCIPSNNHLTVQNFVCFVKHLSAASHIYIYSKQARILVWAPNYRPYPGRVN